MRLILYSKPGCHLCEGLQEKLEQVQNPHLELEIRDITTREDWFQTYQYEIPVLFLVSAEQGAGDRERGMGDGPAEGEHPSPLAPHPSPLMPLPRPSPRATVQQLERMLQKYEQDDRRQ